MRDEWKKWGIIDEKNNQERRLESKRDDERNMRARKASKREV